MTKYRTAIFSDVSDLKKSIALSKLLNAAVDAQDRQLARMDRGDHKQAILYSSINLLCLKRLGLLIRYILVPTDYEYAGRFYADRTTGHLAVLANVRDFRKIHERVTPLGRNFRRVI
jgi:hypothetical protein